MKKHIYGWITLGLSVLLVASILFDLMASGTPSGDPASGLSSEMDEEASGFYVSGNFTGLYHLSGDITVASEADAAQAAVDLGLAVSASDLVPLSAASSPEGETWYQFQQVWQGLTVYGNQTAIMADPDGRVLAASGTYTPVEGLSSEPALTIDDFYACVEEYVYSIYETPAEQIDFDDGPDLVIYPDASGALHLAYSCQVSNGLNCFQVLVDAQNGELLLFEDRLKAYDTIYVESDAYDRDLPMEYDNGSGEYVFLDASRNIALYDAQGKVAAIASDFDEKDRIIVLYERADPLDIGLAENFDFLYYGPVGDYFTTDILEDPLRTTDISDTDTPAWNIYASAAAAYDFYLDVLGRTGYNDQNGELRLVYNASGMFMDDDATPKKNDIITYPGSETSAIFYLGENANNRYPYEKALTVHEFTHSVYNNVIVSTDAKSRESSAIEESYCDVMGELAEAWYTKEDPDWVNAVRDFYPSQDTQRSGSPTIYHVQDFNDDIDIHNASTITSYAMYQLWQDWRQDGLSTEEAMEKMSLLLYRSMYLLPGSPSFTDYGYALMASAYMMQDEGKLTVSQTEYLIEALQDVGIFGSRSNCLIQVNDALTGEPVENASVQLHVRDDTYVYVPGDGSYIYGEIEDLFQLDIDKDTVFLGALNETTNASGQCCFLTFDSGKDYTVTVNADGYEYYRGEVTSFDSYAYLLNTIKLQPETAEAPSGTGQTESLDADALLMDTLDRLASQYGVIATGSETYSGTGYGGGETLIPPERLTGLLCADIYDYDADGQNELLTIRSQPAADYATGSLASPEMILYMTVYEAMADGSVAAADEKQIAIHGLADTLYSSSIQFMRGTQDGQTGLYLDHYFNFNTQTFGLIRLTYDGTLRISGGVDCSEFAYFAFCCTDAGEGALESIGKSQTGSDDVKYGWSSAAVYNWEGMSDTIPEQYMQGYMDEWKTGLEQAELTDSFFRTMYDYDDASVSLSFNDRLAYLEDCCTRRPAQTCQMTGGGSLTELCGILSPYQSADSRVALTCYDSIGLLDAYRGQTDPSTSAPSETAPDKTPDPTDAPDGSDALSTSDLFEDFTTAFLEQDAASIADLYLVHSDSEREELESLWSNRLQEVDIASDPVTSSGINRFSYSGDEPLSDDALARIVSEHGITPEEACLMRFYAYPDWSQIWPDWLAGGIELYAVSYHGNWYLVR